MPNNFISRLLLSFLVILVTNVIVFAKKNIFFSMKQDTIQLPQINWVSVSEDNQVILEWEFVKHPNIESLNIYRSQNADTLNWILLENIKQLNQNVFIDRGSTPISDKYSYKISIVDYCKKEHFSTSLINTVFLKVTKTVEDYNKLEWNRYKDKFVYRIFRGESLDNMQLIDSLYVDSTIYVDKTGGNNSLYYRVETDDIKKKNDVINITNIRSNYFLVAKTRSDSVFELMVKIYPNPIKFDFQIEFPYEPHVNYTLFIADLLGNIHLSSTLNSGSIVLNRGGLKDGLYLLHIKGNKGHYIEKIIFGGKSE